MSDEGHLVFVYGTLRRGASNAFRMEGAEFVRAGAVRGRLYRIDWYPGLVVDSDAGEVLGDVWRVSAVELRKLDQFEGLPEGSCEGSEYRRVRVDVGSVDAAGRIEAWAWEWIGPVEDHARIPDGDWIQSERPRMPPAYSILGCLALVALPVGGGMLANSPLGTLVDRGPYKFSQWFQIGMHVIAPFAAYWCVRQSVFRRESLEIFQFVAWIGSVLYGIAVGLAALIWLIRWL